MLVNSLFFPGCLFVLESECTYSPPWRRRGGRDIKKDAAKPPLVKRTGRLVQLQINRWLNQPPRLRDAAVASRNFLDRAATPPFSKEGNTPRRLDADFMASFY
jgi:hypothetical protein